MVFLKSLGQKYFSIHSDGDETGTIAVVPISGSDDVLSSKQYTQKIKKVLQSYCQKHHEGQRQRSSLAWPEHNIELWKHSNQSSIFNFNLVMGEGFCAVKTDN